MRGYLKGEAKVFQWAVSHGVPQIICRVVMVALKLLCLAAFLYASLWLALYAAAFWVFMKVAELGPIPDGMDEEENGWRSGHSGFGYYCGGYRVDAEAYDD
jgi:hypothetical protein